jgi:hypothetical protein
MHDWQNQTGLKLILMTAIGQAHGCILRTNRISIVHAHAPAERLAALRIVVGVFAVSYLVLRVPVFLQLRDRSAGDLDAVGLFRWLDQPLPDAVVTIGLVVALVSGVAFVAGASFVVAGPCSP